MSLDPNGIETAALAEYEERATRALGVLVPEESQRAVADLMPANTGVVPGKPFIEAVATPVVVAELLALAEKVGALHGNGGPTYRDGFDAAIGAVRELIADRCDELGVKVEDL